MACPGGCIGGAGQPLGAIKNLKSIRESRTNSLFKKDSEESIREAYMNPKIQDAYISYISKEEISLHTSYIEKKTIQNETNKV